jgi:hypothetical protein
MPCRAPERESMTTSQNYIVLLCNADGVSRVYRTKDGVAWTRFYSGYVHGTAIATVSDHRVLLNVDSELLVLSDHGGVHAADLTLVDDEVDRVSMADSSLGYMTSVHGYVFRTRDGGLSWTRMDG